MRLLHYAHQHVAWIEDRRQKSEPYFKPSGFWVSVEGENDWASWCAGDGWDIGEKIHEVTLRDGARILFIRDAAGIDGLTDSFGVTCRYSHTVREIDWRAIARKWQGIIIAPYIWERRLHDRVSWYYTWDCASGCIWDANAVKSIKLLETTS